MRAHGLPPLRRAQDLLRLISLDYFWVRDGLSLSAQAYRAGTDPTIIGRLVKRTTGQRWLDWRSTTTVSNLLQEPLSLPRIHCGK